MKVPHVNLIDYGVGNLWSVVSAIEYLGAWDQNTFLKTDRDSCGS